ncbi:MAG: aspartate aminotransferase family protein [Pseudomonadales bacterium]|jgi:beta-alanine--pyruvate transaminase|nr:aspartate aminotransferase family protein [Pseudomonadales bacterium]
MSTLDRSTDFAIPSRPAPVDLDAYWMPFTANRWFRRTPRLITGARGVHYRTEDGRELLDFASGLWCTNAGHCHPHIVAAVQRQAAQLDYAMAFQLGHPDVFRLASRLAEWAPDTLSRVFFTNSGSEAADTALKIAMAWHRLRGDAGRTHLIGREKGYHGAGFGGTSVGGLGNNRRQFPLLLPGVDHLPHTHDLSHMAYSRGQPQWGGHLADELERRLALHGADSIAAVIVEPVAGSAGVIVPPVGYLQRLRELCTQHGILLVFDEVITGFGRLGHAFGAQRFAVVPDMICCAKGLTSGMVPMGAVLVRQDIYEDFMQGPELGIELPHGYTYSGHPLATAAAHAALDVYETEGVFEHVRSIEGHFEARVHALRDHAPTLDIRNIGLMGAIDLEPEPGAPGRRALGVFERAFDAGLVVRTTGDTIALCPPLITRRDELDQMFDRLEQALAGIGSAA